MPSYQLVDGNFFFVAPLAAIECRKPGCYRYVNNEMAHSSLGGENVNIRHVCYVAEFEFPISVFRFLYAILCFSVSVGEP